MPRKMPRRLVALSSSAIAAIYLAGYLATQGADARLAADAVATPTPPAIVAAPPASSQPSTPPFIVEGPRRGEDERGEARRGERFRSPTNAPSSPSFTVPTSPPAPSTSPPAPSTTSPGAAVVYRDGTYQGQGTSRRGGFTVAVTIQGGRIANVAITRVTTQYPVSRIAGLPEQVVARQSAQVDRVTGATYSVQAFQQAVQQALNQAPTGGPSTGA